MGVEKKIIEEGNGADKPKAGDQIFMQYTGWLYDAQAADNQFRGTQFDSSVNRGEFKTKIGVGQVIKGKSASAHYQRRKTTKFARLGRGDSRNPRPARYDFGREGSSDNHWVCMLRSETST